VLVVEDSLSQRELMIRLLTASGAFTVVGVADNGRQAVQETLRLRPEVIAMDIHLPVMDGYKATHEIMRRCPTPIVLVSASASEAKLIDALAAGALTVIRKPGGHHSDPADSETFLKTLQIMAGVRVVTRFAPRVRPASGDTKKPAMPAAVPGGVQVLALAASTGGPAAVQTVLSGLGAQFPLPVLLVQHIARDFTPALQDWLRRTTPLPVRIAVHGERLAPGHVYLPPDGFHLLAGGRGLIALRLARPDDRYCPSADLLFQSVARVYGAGAMGVILTGMGDDGARGLRELRDRGAVTIAQDEASCVVYGMPRSAVETGAVAHVAALDQIAQHILALVPV
jgi:two-component system chemotaxis response regulator CheB